MKRAKIKKLLEDAQAAHKESSKAFKEVSHKSSDTKKLLKESKRKLATARREYKAIRKTYRELAQSLEDVRKKHARNNQTLEKMTKKLSKLGEGSVPKKQATNGRSKKIVKKTPLRKQPVAKTMKKTVGAASEVEELKIVTQEQELA